MSLGLVRKNASEFVIWQPILQPDRYERHSLLGTSIVYWLICCCLTVFDTVCSRRIGGQSVVGRKLLRPPPRASATAHCPLAPSDRQATAFCDFAGDMAK